MVMSTVITQVSSIREKFFQRSCSPRLIKLYPYAVIVLCVLCCYANVYGDSFIFDDAVLIQKNKFILSWSSFSKIFETTIMAGAGGYTDYYRPLQILAYLTVHKIAGMSPPAFHFLNVALHAVNACLVYRLGRKLGFDAWATLLAALLWAVHPIHVEAVTYLSATADPLFALFCLLGIIVLVPTFSFSRMVLALPVVILGFLSKETTLVFPLLAMSCVWLLSEKPLAYRSYLFLWPFALLDLFYVVFHFFAPIHGKYLATDPSPATIHSNFNLFTSLPEYLKMFFWPVGFYMERSLTPYITFWHFEPMLGLVIAVAAALLVAYAKSENLRPLGWGILWFAGAHVLLADVSLIIYEHWMYLPSVGLFLGSAETISRYLKASKLAALTRYLVGLSALIIIVLSILTLQQNKTWADQGVFARNILSNDPRSPKAHTMLGDVEMQDKNYRAAEAEYRLAIQYSNDALSAPENNLGVALLNASSDPTAEGEAVDHFKRALELEPNNMAALVSLEYYYHSRGDATDAHIYQIEIQNNQKRLLTDTGGGN